MAEEKTSCVLRLFGAPQGQLAGAVGQFAPQWKTQAQWKSRGGETLLALQAASPSGLKKAAQSLQAQFEADLYGAGDTSLAAAVVNALETHDRLLVCSDAAAGALLEARLETVPGAEKVFDFGALSYAHPKAGPQIEKRARARFKAEEPDAVRLALARAQAARRVVGSELAAGCAERGSEKVLVLSSKKGCWLRTVPSSDNAALWLMDMIRRAACDYPQAEGTGFLPARKAAQNGPAPETGTNAAKPEPPRRKHHRGRWLLVLLLLRCGADEPQPGSAAADETAGETTAETQPVPATQAADPPSKDDPLLLLVSRAHPLAEDYAPELTQLHDWPYSIAAIAYEPLRQMLAAGRAEGHLAKGLDSRWDAQGL